MILNNQVQKQVNFFKNNMYNISDIDKNKFSVVYKLTFPNGKIYIGKTNGKLERRIKTHIAESFNSKRNGYNTIKANAIRKYKSFDVSVLYEGIDLDNKEIYFIKNLDSISSGYNQLIGGAVYKKRSSADSTRERLRNSAIGNKSHCKSIKQLDLNGNLIQIFESTEVASNTLNLSRTAITNNVNGWSKKCGKYIFQKIN